MSSASLSFPHRTTARVIISFAVVLMSGAVALASGSTAKRATKRNNASSSKGAIMQVTSPTLSKFFSQDAVAQNATVSMGFSLGSPDGVPLTGVAFTDTFPAGLVVATPNNLANGCGGAVTATSGTGNFSLSGGTIQTDGCVIFVDVIPTGSPGTTLVNTTSTVTTNESNPGAAGTASLQILAQPGISKSFGASTIPLNGTTTLSFTITNPNTATVLTNVGFTDTLPGGLVVAGTPGVTGTCLPSGGGDGVVTANAGSNSISLQSLTSNSSASCSFTVNVMGTTTGVKANTTGNVSGTFDSGGTPFPITGGTASAMTTVLGPPTISKAFSNPGVQIGSTTTLTFTLTNPNPTTALTGVAFTDSFPAGLVVAGTPGVVDGCGGTFTAVAAATSVNLTGGTIAAASSCTISVSVQVTGAGFLTNTTGAVSSTNGGTGTGSNPAIIGGFNVCIKDDTTGAILQWSSTTGAYTFTNCKTGFTLSGTGTARTIGSTQSLTDFKPDRRISATFLSNQLTGSASLSVMVAPGVFQTFSLRQTNPHATCTCP